jgi:phosphonate transport system substrate-binding protein
MAKPTLRALTFLAPNMLPVYRFTMEHLGRKLGFEIELMVGSDYEELVQADLTFICGLPYVLYTRPYFDTSPLEALTAPVLRGDRFQNRPIYFSDVIVRRDSPFHSFADLRGSTWAYNEPQSQSGYGITRYWLVKIGETNGYFKEVVQTGFHQKSIDLVCSGEVDASAIDAQVLAVERRDHPYLAEQLRVIDSLGPSSIQPLAAASRLPAALKRDIQAIFAEIHHDPAGRATLDRGFIDHFETVNDANYDDIREMLAICEQASFLSLK